MRNDLNTKQYLSLARASEGTPYSQEYLSLLVRKGRIKAKKIGRNWYTTTLEVAAYQERQKMNLLKKIAHANGIPSSETTSVPNLIKSDTISSKELVMSPADFSGTAHQIFSPKKIKKPEQNYKIGESESPRPQHRAFVSIPIRSPGICADGSCSERTVRVEGQFNN